MNVHKKAKVQKNSVEWLLDLTKNADETIGRVVKDFGHLMRRPKITECTEFSKQATMDRNRYGDTPCLDISRVRLRQLRDNSDYIHANYVILKTLPCTSIVTQSPLKNTVDDFWSMVWHENATLIVCFVPVETKEAETYWTDKIGADTHKALRHFQLRSIYGEHTDTWELKIVELTNLDCGELKKIYHFQYTELKKLVRIKNFLSFTTRVREVANGHCVETPVRSHCVLAHDIAGMGWSSMFVALLSLMNSVDQNRPPLVGLTVNEMRKQRALSVDRLELYFFLHCALARYIMAKVDLTKQQEYQANVALKIIEQCTVAPRN